MATRRVTLFVHVDIDTRSRRDTLTKAENLKKWMEERIQQDKAPWVEGYDVDYSIEQ